MSTAPPPGSAAAAATPLRRFAPAGPGAVAFWDAAAAELADWIAEDAASVAIVVPRGALVAPLRRALHRRLGVPGRAWAPPPIRPLDAWADELAPAVPVDGLARTMALLDALDAATAEAVPRRTPADRLAFAGGLLEVLDAFAQAGAAGRLDDPSWVRRVADAFGSPAAESRLLEDLALLARLARAIAGDGVDPVAQGIARMRALADAWTARGSRVAWLAWQPPEPTEAVLLAALDERLPPQRVLRLEPDWAAIGRGVPLLRAAWPERFEDADAPPLRERRVAWRAAPAGPRPTVLHAADREREAQLAAQWVHARIAEAMHAGAEPPRVAIVALDRWLARRVRALLERAAVLLDDREGWLLSTTVAATAAMGWLDVVAGDGYYDDLLGWLDSRYVRPPRHGALRGWVERCATRHRYLRGWTGLHGPHDAQSAPAAIAELEAFAAAQARPQPLRAHLDALDRAMRWAGAPKLLAADAAGRQLLTLLEALRRATAGDGHARPVTFAEFRAVFAMVLERRRFYGAIDSPVELLTPADAAGRDVDAVLVLGASDAALPAPPAPLPLVNEPLRTMLGLPTASSAAARQQRDLALLFALPGVAAVTCRSDPGDGTRPSAWIERLEAIVEDAPLRARIASAGRERLLAPARAARPAVPAGRLPPRLSVSGIEHLVACPFRFVAQHAWRLREAPDAVDVPGVRERGELAHAILETFHRRARDAGLALRPDAREAGRALLVEVTDAAAARERALGGGTFGEIAEWRATLERYVDWAIEDAAAGWRWVDGEREGVAAVAWDAADGPRTLRIEGRLDRLDEGAAGLRVVDYKLGGPERLKTLAAAPDRAAQLALYAWMAGAPGEVVASGYLSLRRDKVAWVGLSKPADAVVAAWRERLPRYLARIDGGEAMVASGSECDRCASRGLCRKGHWS
ncbi:MAG: PD-(D/E)XK nuclease family protein [Burkholderiales bacterium]